MSDQSKLELTRKDGNPSLAISRARAEIVARGRRDAAALAVESVSDILEAERQSKRVADIMEALKKSLAIGPEERQAKLRED
jgi:hypothetical protein